MRRQSYGLHLSSILLVLNKIQEDSVENKSDVCCYVCDIHDLPWKGHMVYHVPMEISCKETGKPVIVQGQKYRTVCLFVNFWSSQNDLQVKGWRSHTRTYDSQEIQFRVQLLSKFL